MSLIFKLKDGQQWQDFLAYKVSCGNMSNKQLNDLQTFIANHEYEAIVDGILDAKPISPPARKLIGKSNSSKKRVLYVYPRAENYVLKLLTFLIIRKYDYLFASNLYSFRADNNSKRAVTAITATPSIKEMYSYKVDVSNYFGSVDVNLLMPLLSRALEDDELLFNFLRSLLLDSSVVTDEGIVAEQKGIIAGSPISTFFANLFLSELDYQFVNLNCVYARYSDDIIVFAHSETDIRQYASLIRATLSKLSLAINQEKESWSLPHEEWTFLGFSYKDGVIDISSVSLSKLKAKMRRKSRSIMRWRVRKELDNELAVKAFIRAFNLKLYDSSKSTELNWSRWFFPVINTDASLRKLDSYMQDCIRYIATETRTKARFNFRYEDMKRLGYRSLVHEYYYYRNQQRC